MSVQREIDREGSLWATFRFVEEMLGSFTDYIDHYGTFWDYFCTRPFTMVLIMAYLSRKYFSRRVGVLIS